MLISRKDFLESLLSRQAWGAMLLLVGTLLPGLARAERALNGPTATPSRQIPSRRITDVAFDEPIYQTAVKEGNCCQTWTAEMAGPPTIGGTSRN